MTTPGAVGSEGQGLSAWFSLAKETSSAFEKTDARRLLRAGAVPNAPQIGGS
jgi:hypothetical protein